MTERTDWRISSILHDSVKQFEEHSERTGKILDEARERFKQDYTGTTAGFSMLVITGSLVIAALGISASVSVTGIVAGGIGLITSLVFRHLNHKSQLNYMEAMTGLERERAKFAQRAATLHQIWLHGLPEGTPLAQLQVLLGDTPTVPQHGAAAPKWKSLPPPDEAEEEQPDEDEKEYAEEEANDDEDVVETQ